MPASAQKIYQISVSLPVAPTSATSFRKKPLIPVTTVLQPVMGRTSLAHEVKGSPAPSTRGSTPSNTRRSSSRASRKATQELGSTSYQESRTAYSLPATPITSSFEDPASSKLRRRRRSLSYSEKPSEPNAHTRTSNLKHVADLSGVPSNVSKKRRSRTRDTANGDAASTTASDISRAPTPTSAAKSSGQTEQPRSALVRLKTSGIAASQSARTHSAQSGPNSQESTPAPSSASTRRRPRQSMPEKLNGARSGTSTPRSTTPQPLRKDWEPMALRQPLRPLLSLEWQRTMPWSTSQSTPNNRSSTRTRRRNRQSTTATTPTSSDKGKEASQAAISASKGSTDAESTNKPRKSNLITLTLSRKALESVLSKSKPMEQLSYSPEIADSVEATPVHLYDNNFHFDYDTEMYRNNYGLDGQMDTPASPTSFSTTTSAAARTSESFESEKKFRRNRTRTPKPSGEGTQRQSINRAKSTQPSDTASGQPTPAPSSQKLDMASTAVRTDSPPDKKAETWLRELRAKYRGEKERGKRIPRTRDAGKAGGESMPSPPNHPSTVGNTSSSWTDEDGWTHAGQFNEFGEELLGIPVGYTWVRPNNTYGDDALPQPPIRLKSCEQIEKDKIYGFPPRIGERNLPRDMDSPFFVEDVDEEKAKIKAREEARKRGIATNRSMSVSDIEALIAQHDSPVSLQTSNIHSEAKDRKDAKPKESRKRRRRTDPVIEQNLNGSVPETPDDSRPKRRRKTVTGPAASTPAPQQTPASKPKPTPHSRNRVKDGKESKAGFDAAKEKKTAVEPPKTKERKPALESKTKESKTVAETPKTKSSKDMPGSAKVKADKKTTAPALEHKPGGSAANEADAPKKRRRRRKQPLVKLRIIGPKKEDENGANEGGEHAKESKKRPHSEVEGGSTEKRVRKSPKLDEPKPWPRKIKFKKPSPETNKPKPDEGKPNGAPSTPETPSAMRENPFAVGSQQNETPSSRPRRAAAAAMMAGSKQSAEERARKARRRSRKSTGKEVNGPDPTTPVSTRDG
ncbi:hypothetical protein BJX96DRAFT_164217 [Aspergillus floccosus]